MIKLIALMSKKEAMTRAEFEDHWENTHAKMAHTVPEIKRYVLNFIFDDHSRKNLPPYNFAAPIDGIAELWVDDEAALDRLMNSEASRIVLQDGLIFIGYQHNYFTREKVIIG